MAIVPKNIEKWGARSPTPKPGAAFVRMRHPRERGVYYSSTEAAWVRHGWTVWSYDEWKAKFGNNEDGHHWEFFGYRIPMIRAE